MLYSDTSEVHYHIIDVHLLNECLNVKYRQYYLYVKYLPILQDQR